MIFAAADAQTGSCALQECTAPESDQQADAGKTSDDAEAAGTDGPPLDMQSALASYQGCDAAAAEHGDVSNDHEASMQGTATLAWLPDGSMSGAAQDMS
jgi:hypothetical protein